MQEYVGAWLDAPDDVWDETLPHTEESYNAYLDWYLTRTRPYVTLARVDDAEHQHSPTIADTYPVHRDQEQHGAVRFSQFNFYSYIFFQYTDNYAEVVAAYFLNAILL